LVTVKHGVERIKEVTGSGNLLESTLTRKLCHYVLRQVTGKSFTDVGKATGNGYHIARGDWLAISSYRNQEIWNWIQAVEEYAIGFHFKALHCHRAACKNLSTRPTLCHDGLASRQ
jgi:hypothetical protein